MIIALVGGIGSGKSLSMARMIVNSPNFAVTNFSIRGFDYHRLAYSDIVLENKEGKINVNWPFWKRMTKEHPRYSIYLDELPNFAHARRAMSSKNQVFNRWFSQIRKITGDSEFNHLVVGSQSFYKIDVELRELVHVVIECEKVFLRKKLLILQRVWNEPRRFEMGFRHDFMAYFCGNSYFKHYDTKEVIHFGDEDFI